MVELRQFRQFVAVAEEMSFRRAADRLNMAQPPLTMAVKRIEQELGTVLLERSSRIVRLTQPGRVFLDEARRTIAQAERAVNMTGRAGKGVVGCVRVAFMPSLAHDLLPRILRSFRERHRDVELELDEGTAAQQVAALLSDRADIGLLVTPIAEGTGLTVETVFRDHLLAAIPRRHPLASRAHLVLSDLRSEPWVLPPARQAPGFHAQIVAACTKAGFAPQVAQHAVQLETILGLVAGNLGVSLVPSRLARLRRDVALRKVTGPGSPIRYELGAAWRRTAAQPVLLAFLQTVRAVMSKAQKL
jgi:DNA-binding transcriptional LysR family regulator